jgi:hypothetical protein
MNIDDRHVAEAPHPHIAGDAWLRARSQEA